MFKKYRLVSIISFFLLAIVLVACGGNNENNQNNDVNNSANNAKNDKNTEEVADREGLELGQEDLSIPYVAWARETISTHILAALLEEVGYNVDVKQVEAGPMFAGVAEGSEDFHTSAWLPATHDEYWDEYGDDLVKVTEVLDKAPLALTVPSYMEDVNSIEDLKDNDELGDSVGWEIVGIDPGAGIMQNTERAIEEYGLDGWELLQASEGAMLATLREKIEN